MTRWAIPKILGHAAITTLFVVVVFAQAGGDASAQQVKIQLPEMKATFPEPLPDDGKPGFALRGLKGWLWLPEQYLAEVATLASVKMNFMMICYGSMCDVEHYAWGDPKCNRWWEPLPEEKKRAYEKVIDACKANGVELCLSMNPNLFAERILQYGDENDFELLWQHYAWMQSRGMKWFCLSLDDISRGIDAAGQAQVANTLLHRLREKDAGANSFSAQPSTGAMARSRRRMLISKHSHTNSMRISISSGRETRLSHPRSLVRWLRSTARSRSTD